MLKVENLSIQFKTKKGLLPAVRNISFSVQKGESLGMVGESGCGKSITNLALMGLLSHNAIITADRLEFAGTNLLNLNERDWQKIRGKKIGMIFQDPMSALNPTMKVGKQIDESLKLHRPELDKKARLKESIELLRQVGIPAPEDRLNSYAHELSGGMAQRVMIAVTLAPGPDLLLADEPTTALDVTIQEQVINLIKNLQKERNMGLVFVTHDLAVVARITKRLQVMYAGEIVEAGFTSELIQNPMHPYTFGLIKSLPEKPQTDDRFEIKKELFSIPGMVPNLFNRPLGCQFHPRCPNASQKCHNSTPNITKLNHRDFQCFNPIIEGSI